jgi:hypothetical protein
MIIYALRELMENSRAKKEATETGKENSPRSLNLIVFLIDVLK